MTYFFRFRLASSTLTSLLIIYYLHFLVLPDVFEESEDTTEKPDETIGFDPTVDARHYAALNKEQKKNIPNKVVLNKFLNLEFPSRRKYLQKMFKDDRPRIILDAYQCFKNPCEVY